MTNLIGQTIGQYRILEQIGRGGMATVYKAFQPSMERNVAIKVLPQQLAEDPTFIERFRQEAKAIAQLEHPHILPVYDYGEEKGLTYMVMRYLDSGTLTARLRKRPDVAEVVRLLSQVAEALDYTHSRGIVHRDIKPANVLIDSRGQTLLTDFGIAKLVEGTQGLTGHGIVGTPAYMSPEQAQGLPVDGRSDIYSLGVILYEALVGQPPFEAETPVAVLLKHVHAPLPLPREIKSEISEAMEQVILKAMAKDPADRYQTASEMAQAMQAALTSAGQGLTQVSQTPAARPDLPPAGQTPAATMQSPTPAPLQGGKSDRLAGGAFGWIILFGLVLIAASAGIYTWLRPAPSLATWQFVIDASAGMAEAIEGQPKIDIARAALDKELRILPGNVNAGLRVFGGQESGLDPCQDTKLLVEPVAGRSERIISALAGITPQGEAPLTEAIVQAISDFDLSRDTKNSLIIITGGLDSCEAEAVSQLETLSRRLGIEVDLHLIGLGVEDPVETEQLQELAQAADGDYYAADNEEEIGQVLRDQISIVQGTPVARASPTPTNTPTPIITSTSAAIPTPAAFSLTTPINLSNTPDNLSAKGQIMFDGEGVLHLVWLEQSTRDGGFDLLHRFRSSDGVWSGPNLTTEVRAIVNDSHRLARSPDGQVCVFVAGAGASDIGQKLYSSCFLGGATTEISLTQDQWRDANPAFTPDGVLQIMWNDGALYFGEVELVSRSAGLVYQPTFTIDTAGNYHAAWIRQTQPSRLEYFSSSDGGQTWSEIEQLTGDEDATPSWPRLAADTQGNVHLVWLGGENSYRRWSPGQGWGEAVEIGPNTPNGAWFDLVTDSDGLAHMVWISNVGDIYYTGQQTNGSWRQPQMLVEDALGGHRPTVAIDAQGVRHFAWTGSDQEIYYAALTAK